MPTLIVAGMLSVAIRLGSDRCGRGRYSRSGSRSPSSSRLSLTSIPAVRVAAPPVESSVEPDLKARGVLPPLAFEVGRDAAGEIGR